MFTIGAQEASVPLELHGRLGSFALACGHKFLSVVRVLRWRTRAIVHTFVQSGRMKHPRIVVVLGGL